MGNVRSEPIYLKEFDLDLPYIFDEERLNNIMEVKNCSRDEAIILDYDMSWKDKRRAFSLEIRCITSMFARLFGRMKTKDCWKILTECASNVNEKRIINYSGVYTVQIKFDYNSFVFSDDHEKNKRL